MHLHNRGNRLIFVGIEPCDPGKRKAEVKAHEHASARCVLPLVKASHFRDRQHRFCSVGCRTEKNGKAGNSCIVAFMLMALFHIV